LDSKEILYIPEAVIQICCAGKKVGRAKEHPKQKRKGKREGGFTEQKMWSVCLVVIS